jgi:biofilm PGA synthesis N-glycosyltransferase PgaC
VLDDGSTDGTEAAALEATGGDPHCRVVRDPVNRGKADRLNAGLQEARHPYVTVVDADAHVHPQALKFLAARLTRTPIVAAVAGSPHVTNRGRVIQAMQVLETASIIGLIRRTQSLTGRVGVVAGVLGMFRRDRVLAVGGYDPRMATEDIDLTWKLLLAGWHTDYEPRALVGMQVPSTLQALWAQRTRWARGQGEVLHAHLGETIRWQNHRMWLVIGESLASLLWVVCLAASLVLTSVALLLGEGSTGQFGLALAWGIAIAVVALVQLTIALMIERDYDRTMPRAFLLGPLYPLCFWAISSLAALRTQTAGLLRGPRNQRVVWDIPRESLDAD